MKVPDLSAVDECGVRDWKGSGEPLKAPPPHAGLRYAPVDLGKAEGQGDAVHRARPRARACPTQFRSQTGTRLADVLEDRDWLGKRGRVILLAHAPAYRKDHPTDARMLEEILGEARNSGRSATVPFWVFVGV